jgi:membrane protein
MTSIEPIIAPSGGVDHRGPAGPVRTTGDFPVGPAPQLAGLASQAADPDGRRPLPTRTVARETVDCDPRHRPAISRRPQARYASLLDDSAGSLRRLRAAWQQCNVVFDCGRRRFDSSPPGRVWRQLQALDFINGSLQFAASFTLCFIPFLMVASVLVNADLARGIAKRTGLSSRAASDLSTLFTHSRTPLTAVGVIGLVLVLSGAAAIAQRLQTLYGKVFGHVLTGWPARMRRGQWLAGAAGFLWMQLLIGRRFEPFGGQAFAEVIQFLLALMFWWWSLHCLLAGRVPWPKLFRAGLATAICYTGVGLYMAVFASSSIVSNETTYGPIGAVMTLLVIEVGLGVALHLGAVIGAPMSSIARPPKPMTIAVRAGDGRLSAAMASTGAARRSPASPSGGASVPPLRTDGLNSRLQTLHLASTLRFAPAASQP